eukprot:2286698-Pleurochrysis_carterae.AAC.1
MRICSYNALAVEPWLDEAQVECRGEAPLDLELELVAMLSGRWEISPRRIAPHSPAALVLIPCPSALACARCSTRREWRSRTACPCRAGAARTPRSAMPTWTRPVQEASQGATTKVGMYSLNLSSGQRQ